MYKYLGNTEILMYNFIGFFPTLALLFYNLSQYKKKKVFLSKTASLLIRLSAKKKAYRIFSNVPFVTILELLLVTFFQYYYSAKLNVYLSDNFGTNANYFATLFFIPLILVAFCYVISIDPLKQFDLVTPAFAIALAISKIGCFCQGCCNGIECSFGLYNYDTELVEFPVQLVESAVALLIFFFLLFWKKRAKPGTMFPIYLILYSATRFFSEFLRADPNVFWNLKKYQIICIEGLLLGIVELVIALKFADKIRTLFDKSIIYSFIEKHLDKKKTLVHHKYKKK